MAIGIPRKAVGVAATRLRHEVGGRAALSSRRASVGARSEVIASPDEASPRIPSGEIMGPS